MPTRAEIVAEARTWIGTPFHHQAAAKGAGCDCIGLLRGIGLQLDIPGAMELAQANEFAGYGQDPNPDLLRLGCDRYLDRIARADVRVGDVLLFKTRYSLGQPKHFGVVTQVEPLYMVHAWALGPQRVTENRVDATWQARILACYRFRGLADG